MLVHDPVTTATLGWGVATVVRTAPLGRPAIPTPGADSLADLKRPVRRPQRGPTTRVVTGRLERQPRRT